MSINCVFNTNSHIVFCTASLKNRKVYVVNAIRLYIISDGGYAGAEVAAFQALVGSGT